MDVGKSLQPNVNPANFPAKLWRLVNNPEVKSICWNIRGNGIIVNQWLMEREVLSPASTLSNTDTFKTTNYSSFVRQLNLYGFRKAETVNREHPDIHHFCHPHFKQNHPELLSSMKRLIMMDKPRRYDDQFVDEQPSTAGNVATYAAGDRLQQERVNPPATPQAGPTVLPQPVRGNNGAGPHVSNVAPVTGTHCDGAALNPNPVHFQHVNCGAPNVFVVAPHVLQQHHPGYTALWVFQQNPLAPCMVNVQRGRPIDTVNNGQPVPGAQPRPLLLQPAETMPSPAPAISVRILAPDSPPVRMVVDSSSDSDSDVDRLPIVMDDELFCADEGGQPVEQNTVVSRSNDAPQA